MDYKLLNRAVTEDLTETLKDVCVAAWTYPTPDKLTLLTIANDTNRRLGYELFDDLYHPRLINDFAAVSLAVQQNALKSK